jgi:RNA polymerase sigma-70 factor (ECF subfamily)
LSQNQVAEKLGISISCTKSRAQRGRLKFKELLLQFCHIEFDTYGTPLEYYPNYCETCKKKIKVM